MLTSSGAQVFPGDVIFRQEGIVNDVNAVRGCKLVLRNAKRGRSSDEAAAEDNVAASSSSAPAVTSVVVATIAGLVQYEDGNISVVAKNRATTAVTPTAESKVLMRVQRASRHGVQGNIIAVVTGGAGETTWCHIPGVGGFRGSLRSEDIRPVVSKADIDNKLLSTYPASAVTSSGAVVLPAYASFRPGDIVAAAVTSQTDTKQFQLSTLPDDAGCIASVSLKDKSVKLVTVPGRREGMLNPKTGENESKWCPK